MEGLIGLIGLGTIGAPLAHKLYNKYGDRFVLFSDYKHKEKLTQQPVFINGDLFNPVIVTAEEQLSESIELLIICVKNYDLEGIIPSILPRITKETVILPLQNGVYSHSFFSNLFPNNLVLKGFIQGPNTQLVSGSFIYNNPGAIYLGSESNQQRVYEIYELLYAANEQVFYAEDIDRLVWKKWMLNVAGNSITALTGADYSLFKKFTDLDEICGAAMREFLLIAEKENVVLTNEDIEDILAYYRGYNGRKKTSMLVDVEKGRKTENEFLAGTAVRIAEKHNVAVPIIETLYRLIRIKEAVYLSEA